jgi:hypothetical protein
MGIMVGGIKTLSILSMIGLAVGIQHLPTFGMEFWQELEDFFGPILGPIIRGIFEPVYRVFENPTFRNQFLFTVIWTSIIVAGLVYVVYEVPSFLSWIIGGQKAPPMRQVATRDTRARAQRPAVEGARASTLAVEEKREKKQAIVEEFGVKVQSLLQRSRDELTLEVIVTNGGGHQIDMVVVDIDLPADINTSTDSFRMQRIGTIGAGETTTAQFRLVDLGGDVSLIGGHVEFLSASYEISKISLPAPQIKE